MSDKIVELVVKSVAAGALVVAFAVFAETLSPKRLASLLVTAGFSGRHDMAQAATGMIVGAVAFTVYCLAAVPLVRRWGAWRGSAAALLAWGSVAAAGSLVWL
jgi:hypothetical protein